MPTESRTEELRRKLEEWQPGCPLQEDLLNYTLELEKQVDDLKSQLDLANEHIHDMKEAMHDLSDIRKQCD